MAAAPRARRAGARHRGARARAGGPGRRATGAHRIARARGHTLRRELEESRERFNQTATFSKEREFLALREIIKQEGKGHPQPARGSGRKERQVLDHKDKIRELDRAAP